MSEPGELRLAIQRERSALTRRLKANGKPEHAALRDEHERAVGHTDDIVTTHDRLAAEHAALKEQNDQLNYSNGLLTASIERQNAEHTALVAAAKQIVDHPVSVWKQPETVEIRRNDWSALRNALPKEDARTALTADQGAEVERIMARFAPAWVRALRDGDEGGDGATTT